MVRYSLREIRKRELEELEYLEKWYFVMSGFKSKIWRSNPYNKERIKRLKELRKKYLMDIITGAAKER
ncbi:hypothetical protein J7L27_00990 [Candidatus Bathyarchaeota archaeon]|nr:hypothetical protein [Candidatus Bathyarchaeota archaeon]